MGIIRDSFIMFRNWAEAIEALPQKYQLECYKGLMKYGTTGEMPENISPISKALLVSFSVTMENSICRYVASVENGKKGGRPPKNKNLEKPSETQQNLEEPNPNLYVNDNDNIKRNTLINKSVKKSAHPTKDEVVAYAKTRDRLDLAVKFWEYYEAGGWKDVTGATVKNWKQKFLTWCNKQPKPNNSVIKQQEYTDEDFNGVFDKFNGMEV